MIAGSWPMRRVVRKEYIYYCLALPHVCRYVPFVGDLTLNWYYQCNTSVTNVFCVLLLLPLVKCDLCQGERLSHSKNSHINPYDYWITIIVANIVVNMTSISVVFLTVLATLRFVFLYSIIICSIMFTKYDYRMNFPSFHKRISIYSQTCPYGHLY